MGTIARIFCVKSRRCVDQASRSPTLRSFVVTGTYNKMLGTNRAMLPCHPGMNLVSKDYRPQQSGQSISERRPLPHLGTYSTRYTVGSGTSTVVTLAVSANKFPSRHCGMFLYGSGECNADRGRFTPRPHNWPGLRWRPGLRPGTLGSSLQRFS